MNKADKQKLDAGAAEIHKAPKEVAASPFTAKELASPTRDIKQVMRDRVKIQPGHIGLILRDETTLAECLQILDNTVQLHAHVQFLIGDVINFGCVKWGEKYEQAMEQTGRANATLRTYASVARRIPLKHRQAALSFEHHREIVKLKDDSTPKLGDCSGTATNGRMLEVLREVAAQAAKGNAPSVSELRETVQRAMPSHKAKKRKAKPPAPDEQTGTAEPDDSAAPVTASESEAEPEMDKAPKGWQPDMLTEDGLASVEAKIIATIKAYAKHTPASRRKAFKRYICEGVVL